MESFEHLTGEERIRAENEFLKMKMMLEKGAEFYSESEGNQLPAQLEQMFLHNIMEFERQFDQHKTIKIFDKIGRPTQFKPVSAIGDPDIGNAWTELSQYMRQHGITLDACSPRVTARDLYRFALEELFQYEITDMNIPGMMQGFIYDEFHPDHVYDNTRISVEEGIKLILSKQPVEYLVHFRREKLCLNKHYPVSDEEFKSLILRFKDAYDSFEEPQISHVDCTIDKNACVVKGEYAVTAFLSGEPIHLSGKWLTELEFDNEIGYWYLHTVLIEGIEF
jgi:hypothetical protein